MTTGASLLVVGVDGMEYDVVCSLGPEALPNLYPLVAASSPHRSTLPPDSVPSWISIVTGIAPETHGELHNVKYMTEKQGTTVTASLTPFRDRCFWDSSSGTAVAVVNPFLAYPPWAPCGTGAMVSGPSFSEASPSIADPRGLLVDVPLPHMGGFASIPTQAELEPFVDESLHIADAQFRFSLTQLEARRWDLFFHTNLIVDRIQHFAWRHFDPTDPSYPGPALAHLVPAAYKQVDDFLGKARALCRPSDVFVVLSDHGHGQRASIGVNLHELFRREGLFLLERRSALRRAVETAKTYFLWAAGTFHFEDVAIALARRMPAKNELKSGAIAGRPQPGSVSVPDVGGSNPFGGIYVGDDRTAAEVITLLESLEHMGRKVVRWCRHSEDVLPTGTNDNRVYPTLLFEMDPRYGPTWNMYGPVFMPIVTHKRMSGGHTRNGVFATNALLSPAPGDSVAINEALRKLASGA